MLTDEEAVDDALASAARLNCTLWARAAELASPLNMNKKVHFSSHGRSNAVPHAAHESGDVRANTTSGRVTFAHRGAFYVSISCDPCAVVLETNTPRFWYLAAAQCGVPAPATPSVVDFHARFLNPGSQWQREMGRDEQGRLETAIAALCGNGLVLVVALVLGGLALHQHLPGTSRQRTGSCVPRCGRCATCTFYVNCRLTPCNRCINDPTAAAVFAVAAVALVNAIGFSLVIVHYSACAEHGRVCIGRAARDSLPRATRSRLPLWVLRGIACGARRRVCVERRRFGRCTAGRTDPAGPRLCSTYATALCCGGWRVRSAMALWCGDWGAGRQSNDWRRCVYARFTAKSRKQWSGCKWAGLSIAATLVVMIHIAVSHVVARVLCRADVATPPVHG